MGRRKRENSLERYGYHLVFVNKGDTPLDANPDDILLWEDAPVPEISDEEDAAIAASEESEQ